MDLFEKFGGHRHGVLARHRVGHEKDLVGPGLFADVFKLRHHLGIDMQPARRVDDGKRNPVACCLL